MWNLKGELQEATSYIHHGPSPERPNGQWNTIDVYTVGDKIIHALNGKVNMVLHNTRQKTKHGPALLTRGQIKIQSEAAECYYRDVKIRHITKFPLGFAELLK